MWSPVRAAYCFFNSCKKLVSARMQNLLVCTQLVYLLACCLKSPRFFRVLLTQVSLSHTLLWGKQNWTPKICGIHLNAHFVDRRQSILSIQWINIKHDYYKDRNDQIKTRIWDGKQTKKDRKRETRAGASALHTTLHIFSTFTRVSSVSVISSLRDRTVLRE